MFTSAALCDIMKSRRREGFLEQDRKPFRRRIIRVPYERRFLCPGSGVWGEPAERRKTGGKRKLWGCVMFPVHIRTGNMKEE